MESKVNYNYYRYDGPFGFMRLYTIDTLRRSLRDIALRDSYADAIP
jgi:hypothetical protein